MINLEVLVFQSFYFTYFSNSTILASLPCQSPKEGGVGISPLQRGDIIDFPSKVKYFEV